MRVEGSPADLGAVRTESPSTRRQGLTLAAGAAAAAIAISLLGLAITGGLSGSTQLFDPGPLVRYALPAVKAIHDLAAAGTVGFLVTATWLVGAPSRRDPDSLEGARAPLIRAAIVSSVCWGIAGLLNLVLTASDVSGVPPSTPGFASITISFIAQIDLGRELGVSLVAVIVTANLAILATRWTTLAWAAVMSLTALLPLALTGHASGSRDHMNAVDALAFHLVGVCLWVGGLMALLLVAGRLGTQLPTVAQRYSRLAGWCLLTVALSGVISAVLRLGDWSGLFTRYGLLVVGKALALGALGLAGLAHRRYTLRRIESDRSWFVRLAAVEVVVMAGTIGLAVALAASEPPVPVDTLDRVSALLGQPGPPPLTVWNYATQFYPDVLWLAVAVVAAGGYLAGAIRLWRRGDAWSVPRTVSWAVGCALLVLVTSGGIGVYGRLHFSTHMVQHMMLMITVPFFLVIGAPITLALRAVRSRSDGSIGPRETLLRLVHSRALRMLGHPLFSEAFFIISLIAFYYSALLPLAMFTHGGHVLMTAHFLLVGYLFIWSLIGSDPGPKRPPYVFRLVLLLMAMGFHAIFGITLMSSGSVLAPDWWHALGYTDDSALLADQQLGGGIAWGTGDLPAFALAIALLVVWFNSDRRESRRRDRRADRDGDAELRAYNERLAAIHRQDRGSPDAR